MDATRFLIAYIGCCLLMSIFSTSYGGERIWVGNVFSSSDEEEEESDVRAGEN